MSPCQFLSTGEVKNKFVAATAFANATMFVLAAAFVPAAMPAAFVRLGIGVRFITSASGMESSRDQALLNTNRFVVSETMRPLMRSPVFSSRETVCAKALHAASQTAAARIQLL